MWLKGVSDRVIVDEKGIKNSWKKHMEKLTNEENEWDHGILVGVSEMACWLCSSGTCRQRWSVCSVWWMVTTSSRRLRRWATWMKWCGGTVASTCMCSSASSSTSFSTSSSLSSWTPTTLSRYVLRCFTQSADLMCVCYVLFGWLESVVET